MAQPLKIGDRAQDGNGIVTIVDEDRLCYAVENVSKNARGIRTISKALLDEFIKYLEKYPNATAKTARAALSGKSKIDRYEYGYEATLLKMAKMALGECDVVNGSQSTHRYVPDAPLQRIFYGAPGTGKSQKVDSITQDWKEEQRVVRTTFHPDSDYSTFVGCYKPSMSENDKIVYQFVPQAFLKAYVSAWEDREKPEYLIIEEINRGNCAQIFGDLFQLLDRNDYGYSQYPILADKDLQKYLGKALEGIAADNFVGYENVQSGEELVLPSNLYVWATMNTSDQSLFPIDSAFKRRWDWTYMPIAPGIDKNTGKKLNWTIEVAGKEYDWWKFLEAINDKISETTNSEDKKLGFFFCKADGNDKISAEIFVSKVIFYLWNDVFKDYGFEDGIFNDLHNQKLTFDKFYKPDGQVDAEKADRFLSNLLEKGKAKTSGPEEEEDSSQAEE